MPTLTGDQGYVQYKPAGLSADVDATAATFHVRQSPAFVYPVAIEAPVGARTWTGGRWIGDDIALDSDWRTEYDQGNSAAFRIENAPNFTLRGAQFDRVWDGFRPSGGNCANWLVEGVLATNVRDDFVENDFCNSGAIRDCLVDGAMCSCISTTGGGSTTGASKVVTIEDSLFRSKLYLVEGVPNMHGGPFKCSKNGVGYNPRFVVNRCVFAIENPNHNGGEAPGGRLWHAFQNMTATASHWLNLSDTPFSAAYRAMIPAGFTVLEGQPARDLWAQKRSAWRIAHGYDTPTPPNEEEPDMQAAIAALNAAIAALGEELAALDARVVANAEAIDAIEAPDLGPITAELARLDGRLDAIGAASAD